MRKIGRALYMRIRIEDNVYDCLIDTGSEVNLMPIKHVKGMKLQPSSRWLQAANGTTIGVLGEMDIQVDISRRRIPTKFIVSDQVDEILIGVEWLQENNCQIIFPKNSIMINGEAVPLLKKAMGVRCNRIILQEEVCVPASSEMNVMGKMVYTNLPTTNKGTWATCPTECKPGVHTACSLILNRSMNIPVRIRNVKQQPQTIEKGAYLTTVQEVTLLNSETSQEVISEDRRAKTKVHIDNIIGQVDPDKDDDCKLKLRQLLEKYQNIITSSCEIESMSNIPSSKMFRRKSFICDYCRKSTDGYNAHRLHQNRCMRKAAKGFVSPEARCRAIVTDRRPGKRSRAVGKDIMPDEMVSFAPIAIGGSMTSAASIGAPPLIHLVNDGSQVWRSRLEPCYPLWTDTIQQRYGMRNGPVAPTLNVVPPSLDPRGPANCGASLAVPKIPAILIGSNTGRDTPVQDERCEAETEVTAHGLKGGEAFRDPGKNTFGAEKMHEIEQNPERERKELALIDNGRWHSIRNENTEAQGTKEESQEETLKKLADAKKMITWIGERVPKDKSDANVEKLCQQAFKKHSKVGSLTSMRVIVMSMLKGMELQRKEQKSASTMGAQAEGRDIANASMQTALTVRGVELLLMPRDYATGVRRKRLRPEDQRMLDEVIAKTKPEPGRNEGCDTKVMRTATESFQEWDVMADVAIGMDSANNVDL